MELSVKALFFFMALCGLACWLVARSIEFSKRSEFRYLPEGMEEKPKPRIRWSFVFGAVLFVVLAVPLSALVTVVVWTVWNLLDFFSNYRYD